jgi:hypothetical protein
MLEVWNGDIEEVLHLLRDFEIFHNLACLRTKISIDLQGVLGVNMRHFEVML